MFARHSLWVFFFFLTYLINKFGINFGGGWDNYLNWFFFPRSSSIVPMPFIGKPSLPRSVMPPLAYINSYIWQVCIEAVNPMLSVSLSRLRCALMRELRTRLPRSLTEGDGAGGRAGSVVWACAGQGWSARHCASMNGEQLSLPGCWRRGLKREWERMRRW